MEYKVGDKVLCKKDYNYFHYNNDSDIFISGKYYSIVRSNNEQVGLESKTKRGHWNFLIINKLECNESISWLHDHFYTKSEMRKLKLDNLKSNNEL